MKNRRQSLALRSLSRVPPSSSEAEELHSFYLKYGREEQPDDGAERVWMGDTITEKTMLMFPQERKYVQSINNSPMYLRFILPHTASIRKFSAGT